MRVYKFAFNRQEYLVAYRPPTVEQRHQDLKVELLMIDFYHLDTPENFYDDLKRYVKSEG